MAQRHSVDDYLETIWFLAFPIGEYRPSQGANPALASRVAEMLGVSRASAGEMLKRMEEDGLVQRGEHKEAILTKTGRERAERVVRKHRIIERLLTDFMGYTAAEAHVHADELGDTFSDEMIERMEEKLGNPERCPHGWPVDTELEQRENRELGALSDLGEGDRATIVRLAEHDGELLHWFYDEGLVPGTKVEVRGRQTGGRAVDGKAERRRADGRRPRRVRPLRQAVVAAAGEAGGLAERIGLVGALPREVVVVAAEVAVGGGLRVDRAAQVEVADDRGRPEVEVVADELLDLRAGIALGAEAVDLERDRVRDADRVGDLQLAAAGQAGGDDVLRHVAGGVGGRAVDLRRVLARERAAAVPGGAP